MLLFPLLVLSTALEQLGPKFIQPRARKFKSIKMSDKGGSVLTNTRFLILKYFKLIKCDL
jgi:hypothetical protein